MERDARRMRGERPFVFTNLKTGQGLQDVIAFIEAAGHAEDLTGRTKTPVLGTGVSLATVLLGSL